MTDIASLAFKIDSSQAKSATSDLDSMSTAASKAQASALLLQRSLEQGRLSFEQYAQGMLLLGNNAVTASRSIDEMVDRVARLSRTIADIGGDAGRPLREAIAQLQGLGQQFGTGAAGIENFARASRDIGLSSQETVSALQRIQLAIEGVTEQGRQARQVLEAYGVSLRGLGRNDADLALRQFRDQVARFGDDIANTRNITTVLGPTSAETMMALTWPEYRSIEQRRRELLQSTDLRNAAALREQTMRAFRSNERAEASLADLENNYGVGGGSIASWFLGLFMGEPDRRRMLEERSRDPFYQELNAVRRGERIIGDTPGDIWRRQNPQAYAESLRLIEQLREAERHQTDLTWAQRARNYNERLKRAQQPGGLVLTEEEQDLLGPRPEAAPDAGLLAMRGQYWNTFYPNRAERDVLAAGGNMIDAVRARRMEEARQVADERYGRPDQAKLRREFLWMQENAFNEQVDLLRARSDSQLWHQINIMGAGTEARARGDIAAAAMAQARAQADASGLTDPRLLLHVIAAQGAFRASMGAQAANIQTETMERLAGLAGSNLSGSVLSTEMRRAQAIAQYAEPRAIAKMLGLDKAAEEIERFAKRTADASDSIGTSAARLNANLTQRGITAGYALLAETAGMDPRGRSLQSQYDAEALRLLGPNFMQGLDERERIAGARAYMQSHPDFARTVQGNISYQEDAAAQASEGAYLGQLALAQAGTTGDPRSDRYARFNAQLYAIRLRGLSPVAEQREIALASAGFQADEARRYNSFALQQDYALQDAALRLSRFGAGWAAGVTDGIAPVSPGGEIFRNNPLNLRPSRAQWEGQTGTLGGFLTFSAPEYGVRAALLNAMTQLGRTDGTLQGLISRWAPATDGNNPDAYANFVATRMGISPTDRLNLSDPFQARSLMAAMARFETGREVDFGIISRGVSMALGRGGAPAQLTSRGALPAIAGTTPQAFDPRLTYDQALAALYGTAGMEVELRTRQAMRSDSSNDEAAVRFKTTLQMAAEAIERLGQASARATVDIENNSRISAARARSGLAGSIESALVAAQPEIESARNQARDLRQRAALETDPARAQALLQEANRIESLANARPEQIRQGIISGSHDAFTEESAALDRQGRVYELQLRNPFASDLTQARNIALFRAEQDLRYRYTDPRTGDMAISEEEIQQRLGVIGRQFDQQQLIRENQQVRDTFVSIGQASGAALEQIILNGGRARQVMAQLTAQISQMLMTLAMKPVNNMLGNMMGSAFSAVAGMFDFDMGSVGRNLVSVGGVPNAIGNVYDRGRIVPMAQGDVFEGVAMRPMAGGGTAMMGEAGPEAAVPLVRLPSGNLGVRAAGGNGVFAPSITINMNGGGGGGVASAEQARQVADLVQKALKEQYAEMTRDQMRIGGMLNPVYRR